jgi:GNAT superfamily N-acetyltransferase
MALFKKIVKLFWDDNQYVVYKYDEKQQGAGAFFDAITVYQNLNEIPTEFKDIIFKGLLSFILKNRLRKGGAKLMVYSDNRELGAYGWLQSGAYFKRKFGFISKEASMFGPYWVHPNQRGKGIYGKLLNHSIFENKGEEAIIYTHPTNIASQKGIQKAGFTSVGVFRLILVLRIFLIKQKM